MSRATFCIVLFLSRSAFGSIVVPNSLADAEGNSNNCFPFGFCQGNGTMRYQQVYASSQFSAPILIGQFLFRPDANTGAAFSAVLPDIQINMSTTSKAPDSLSTTFADNVGVDDSIVYARGALALSSSFTGPVVGPKTFDILISLTSPFLYNPGAGNLLLDVRNYQQVDTTQFDSHDVPTGVVSRMWSFDVNTATTGEGGTATLGLVTEFGAVPEPSTVILITAGTIPFWLMCRSRTRRFPCLRSLPLSLTR